MTAEMAKPHDGEVLAAVAHEAPAVIGMRIDRQFVKASQVADENLQHPVIGVSIKEGV